MKGRIRELRLKAKMNQTQLGELLGVSQDAISKIEKGINNPTVQQIEALSKFFNVTTDYLLFGIESTKDIAPIEQNFLKIIRTDKSVYDALVGIMNSKNNFERMAA